jgi:tetratricopeptide (TPR) repeat protein
VFNNQINMKKLTLIIYIFTLTTFSYGQKPLKTLIKENEKSVFLVQCFDDKNQMVSNGSGFFIDKAGTAYTNVHVIKNAYQIKIKTIDGKYYKVEKIIDYNPTLDIAKIKILNPTGIDFHTVKISTNKSEKGDEVFTIGNPDGLESSVSSGIISSVRTIPDYGECYQITASISPGSSGGALFNMRGEVIGVTSFGQIDNNRLNQNLNFAVNINNAKYLNQNLNLNIEMAYKKITYENFIPSYMKSHLSGDYENAIKVCTEQIKLKPNDGIAYHLRATTLLLNNELTLAEMDFNNSLNYSQLPSIKEWDYIGLGKIYRKSGQYIKAKENYMKALEINNKNAATYCNLSILATDWFGRENELVESSYMMALKIDPFSCPFGYKTMAEKLIQNGEYEKALSFLTRSIQTEKEVSLSINEYYNRGTCYYHLKKYETAIADFQVCIGMVPSDAQSYHWIGLCNIQLGRKIDACAAMNKAYEVNNAFNKNAEEGKELLNSINTYCK